MAYEMGRKSVLVTGATGLIGGRVAALLLSRGATVRVLARTSEKASRLARAGAEIVKGDMTDQASLRSAVEGCRAVFHFAGVLADEFKPASYFRRVNVEGTRALAEAALAGGVERFIHASTVAVYGFDAGARTSERAAHVLNGDPYSDTKLEGQAVVEELAAERGLPAVIIQPSQVYGPGDDTWTAGPVRLALTGRLVLPGGGRGLLQPIFVDDLAEGVLAAAERGRTGEAYILCGSEVVTVADFFGRLARMAGRNKIPSVPYWVGFSAAALSEWWARLSGAAPAFTRSAVRFVNQRRTSFDGTKAEKELGFVPRTTLDSGFEAVHAWLQSAGIVKRAPSSQDGKA
jgi:nucleoside-diphosphate-sugar epimerase